MTKDEVIKIASELGITVEHGVIKHRVELLETFARLVRDAALEEAARRFNSPTTLIREDSAAERVRALKENGK